MVSQSSEKGRETVHYMRYIVKTKKGNTHCEFLSKGDGDEGSQDEEDQLMHDCFVAVVVCATCRGM